jgi:hypothetical protein
MAFLTGRSIDQCYEATGGWVDSTNTVKINVRGSCTTLYSSRLLELSRSWFITNSVLAYVTARITFNGMQWHHMANNGI